ncbi:MAG: ABC transporter permease, partial [Sphingomonadales bacterium]
MDFRAPLGHACQLPNRRKDLREFVILRNYFIAAWRVLSRHRLYTAINIGGLAIGLAACFLILLFVRDELSFDRSFEGAGRIYRLEATTTVAGRALRAGSSVQALLRQPLLADFPAIETAARARHEILPVSLGEDRYSQEVLSVDREFFDLFRMEFVNGSPAAALSDISSLVLTESEARRLFGEQPALGRTLRLDYDKEMRVTGVIRDLPKDTHFSFQALRLIDPANYSGFDNWGYHTFLTYFRLSDEARIEDIASALPAFIDRHVPVGRHSGPDAKTSDRLSYVPVALKDIHLNSFGAGGMKALGSLTTITAFAVIAALILLIAGINFVNLSTARSTQRAREVAIRKLSGARRSQLVTQFLAESAGLAFLALLLALILVELALPWYNQLLGSLVSLEFADDLAMIAAGAALALIVGLGAGLHPAFVLSSFRPARILKSGPTAADGGKTRMRTMLVVIQFTISIILIITTGVIYQQIDFTRSFELGFKKDNVLLIRNAFDPHVEPAMKPLMAALAALPEVRAVTRSYAVPGDNDVLVNRITYRGLAEGEDEPARYQPVDLDFLAAYGVKPLAGRLFDAKFGTDVPPLKGSGGPTVTRTAVINLTMVRKMGFASAEEAVGENFTTAGRKPKEYRIVGVVPDLYFDSLKTEMQSTYFTVENSYLQTLSVHFQTADLSGFLANVDRLWLENVAGAPIEREFMVDNLAKAYAAEEARGVVLAAFSALAVLVSCLGLFGLAAFAAERKTKEIGVRKVFGATVPEIVGQMAWQFSKPVVIANIIA